MKIYTLEEINRVALEIWNYYIDNYYMIPLDIYNQLPLEIRDMSYVQTSIIKEHLSDRAGLSPRYDRYTSYDNLWKSLNSDIRTTLGIYIYNSEAKHSNVAYKLIQKPKNWTRQMTSTKSILFDGSGTQKNRSLPIKYSQVDYYEPMFKNPEIVSSVQEVAEIGFQLMKEQMGHLKDLSSCGQLDDIASRQLIAYVKCAVGFIGISKVDSLDDIKKMSQKEFNKTLTMTIRQLKSDGLLDEALSESNSNPNNSETIDVQ